MLFLRIFVSVLLSAIALCLLYVLFTFVCMLFVDTRKEYKKNSKFYRFLLYSWTALALFVTNVKVRVTGAEKLPKGRFVLVENHRSAYDAIVTWHAFRKCDLAFVSKQENFRIPMFGRLVRRCCFMAIDRENARNALKTVAYACELMTSDECSVAVYPEGTRNRGEGLLPFHNSVFKIAQKANAPIVVVVARGTDKIASRTPWKRSEVHLEVVEVISAEEVASTRTVDLGEKISAKMLQYITKHEGENE